MTPLPHLMVAPNGARLGKADHPALPISVAEIAACARTCHAAGAGGIHAHVRDADGRHVLDAGLYRELMDEIAATAPGMVVQVTTEAAGQSTPAEQRALVATLRPASVSVALSEMTAEPDEAPGFYAFCADAGIAVQHILYDAGDIADLGRLVAAGKIPRQGLQVLHVLGRYGIAPARPAELDARLAAQAAAGLNSDWAVCAFGHRETDCLLAAARAGGKLRVGFENNLTMHDGGIAPDNAARVREVALLLAGVS